MIVALNAMKEFIRIIYPAVHDTDSSHFSEDNKNCTNCKQNLSLKDQTNRLQKLALQTINSI